MRKLYVAATEACRSAFECEREVIDFDNANFTEVSIAVMTAEEAKAGKLERVESTAFGIPVVILNECGEVDPTLIGRADSIIDCKADDAKLYGRQIDTLALKYEKKVLPPFFGSLEEYVGNGYAQFDCPGHQGGAFFRRHPAGREFAEFFGENIFRSDLCNADVSMGDLLIHEGAPCVAQQEAARIYNADKTYFVLNGTSASNKVVLNALLAPGNLVLFDRNNHKSNHHGALLQAGATPIYLETARNAYGFIGGIDEHCFDEPYLRDMIREVRPEKADAKRPFRLAIIQLGTYDGTIYNARQVVDRIGHLCDYILFDSAWVGYEQFIPMMKDCSPLLLDLGPEDPGIFVTQSVHKQQAGFSQTSQIHKKDSHIKGQSRYCPHKRLNNAFMMHASTSPFYPLFAALDVNAKMHEGQSGQRLWADCVRVGIEARKLLMKTCKYIKPFVPAQIDGKSWGDYPTDEIAQNLRFFEFEPTAKWHNFEGYGEHQYFVDPCKFLLTTPGIDAETGNYADFGVPATILANFLRENAIVPEKCDLNSILFLMTPAEDTAKMEHLITQIKRFEEFLDADAPLADVLPSIYYANEERYKGYTIRRLCQEMHDFYKSRNVKQLQKEMFRRAHFPHRALDPQQAHFEFIRGNAELVPLEKAAGRIAVEGALPYPPGVLCCVPGEVWGDSVLKYFLALEEGINRCPGFAPELQGVYIQKDADGRKRAYGYVLTKDRTAELGIKG